MTTPVFIPTTNIKEVFPMCKDSIDKALKYSGNHFNVNDIYLEVLLMIIKTILSVLSIIFSLLMLYITNLNYKKNILKKIDTIIWSLVWLSIIFISIRPKIIDNYFIENFSVDIFSFLVKKCASIEPLIGVVLINIAAK